MTVSWLLTTRSKLAMQLALSTRATSTAPLVNNSKNGRSNGSGSSSGGSNSSGNCNNSNSSSTLTTVFGLGLD